MKLLQALPEKVIQGRNACLKNADNMLTASRVVFEQKLFNVAYHLGVVALEEIGKACMLAMSGMKELEEEDRNLKHIDDHVKKIFWALFDISFSSEPLTKKALEQNTRIAHVIHDLRLKSMYVDVTEAGISTPDTAITEEQAEDLINLAAARLQGETAHRLRELTPEDRSLFDWLIAIKDDPQWSKVVFSRPSMEKLAEFYG